MGAGHPGAPSSKVYLLGANSRAQATEKAAWLFEDQSEGSFFVSDYPSAPEARCVHFQMVEAARDMRWMLFALMVLGIFEAPAWCNNDGRLFDSFNASEKCLVTTSTGGLVDPTDILLSTVPYFPPGVALTFEVLSLTVIARKFLLERLLEVKYFRPILTSYVELSLVHFGLFMVVVGLADCAFFAVVRPHFRLTFLYRSGLLLTLPSVQNLMKCVMTVFREIMFIVVTLACTIAFFAWVVVEIFNDHGAPSRMDGRPINTGLGQNGFLETLNTMFIAGTTDEFVDVLQRSYTEYRVAGLLWLFFLILVHVLLLNLVLDTLVAAYSDSAEQMQDDILKEKVRCLRKVFDILTSIDSNLEIVQKGLADDDEDDQLSEEAFVDFVLEIGRSPKRHEIHADMARVIFNAVDEDGSGALDCWEFVICCCILEYHLWTTQKDSPVKQVYPRLWESRPFQWFCERMDNGDDEEGVPSSFDQFMNWVLFLNLVLVVQETVYDMNNWVEPVFLEKLEFIFSMVYVTECGLRLSVYSWPHYKASHTNKFDFLCTWMLAFTSVLEEFYASGISRYVGVMRLFRLARVVKQLKKLQAVQLMMDTISKLAAASAEILTLLWVVVYFFTMLSMQLWGGVLYKTNPLLEGTEYEEKKMFVFNFNDFLMSFGTWVVILLCEYVPTFVDAVHAASSLKRSWIVFLVFYIFGVSIVFELVKAFTIEVFVDLHKEWGEPEEEMHALAEVAEKYRLMGETVHFRCSSAPNVERMEVVYSQLVEELEADVELCEQRDAELLEDDIETERS